MDYTHYRCIRFALDRGVMTLHLNRPDALNAVDAELHTELSTVFADLARDRAVRAVVLTGAGDAFCAGGDLAWLQSATPEDFDAMIQEARKIIIDLVELPQPIVAAVNGAAIGLGATLALFCDVVYAADNARLADPHVRIGVAAGDGGAVIWPLLVGPARAKQYLLTGDSLTGATAERIGLVNFAVPKAKVLVQAQAFAQRLADGASLAVRSTKASVNKLLRDAVNLVLDTSLALEKQDFLRSDHKTALAELLDSMRPAPPADAADRQPSPPQEAAQ